VEGCEGEGVVESESMRRALMFSSNHQKQAKRALSSHAPTTTGATSTGTTAVTATGASTGTGAGAGAGAGAGSRSGTTHAPATKEQCKSLLRAMAMSTNRLRPVVMRGVKPRRSSVPATLGAVMVSEVREEEGEGGVEEGGEEGVEGEERGEGVEGEETFQEMQAVAVNTPVTVTATATAAPSPTPAPYGQQQLRPTTHPSPALHTLSPTPTAWHTTGSAGSRAGSVGSKTQGSLVSAAGSRGASVGSTKVAKLSPTGLAGNVFVTTSTTPNTCPKCDQVSEEEPSAVRVRVRV
jgi:hypothetical protein